MAIVLNGLPALDPVEDSTRSFLIWGAVGSGKTPLLATLPAPILWLMFDKDGYQSITQLKHRYDMYNFAQLEDRVSEEFMKPQSPLMRDIESALKAGSYRSVVLDSLSAFLDKALAHGISRVPAPKNGPAPSLIAPQLQGYGARGAIIKGAINTLNQLCSKYNVNFGMTAHEKVDVNNDGQVTNITMMLGGEAAVQIPKNVSEIWRLEDKGSRRLLYLRNFGHANPMRTRLFNPTREFFEWKFNLNDWDGTTVVPGTLEYYLDQWVKGGGKKLELPQ